MLTASTTADFSKHFEYLKRISSGAEALVSVTVAEQAKHVWLKCMEMFGSLLVLPAAGATPDGQIIYSWDSEEHHLEAEIFGGTHAVEWFYRNRESGEFWEQEIGERESLSGEIVSALRHFLRPPLEVDFASPLLSTPSHQAPNVAS